MGYIDRVKVDDWTESWFRTEYAKSIDVGKCGDALSLEKPGCCHAAQGTSNIAAHKSERKDYNEKQLTNRPFFKGAVLMF